MPEHDTIITVRLPDGRTQRYVGPHADQVAAQAEAKGAVRIDQGQGAPAIEAEPTPEPSPIVEWAPQPAPSEEPAERPSTLTARQPRVRRDPASGDVIAVEDPA